MQGKESGVLLDGLNQKSLVPARNSDVIKISVTVMKNFFLTNAFFSSIFSKQTINVQTLEKEDM